MNMLGYIFRMKITLSYVPHIAAFICVTVQSKRAMNDLLFFPLVKDGLDCYSSDQINLLVKTLNHGETVEFIK